MEVNFRKVRPVLSFISPVCVGRFLSALLKSATDLSQFPQQFLGSSVVNVAYDINQHHFKAIFHDI